MYNTLHTSDGQKLTFVARTIKVKLEGRRIGDIKPEKDGSGVRYWPRGSKVPGEKFLSIEDCQRSLQ